MYELINKVINPCVFLIQKQLLSQINSFQVRFIHKQNNTLDKQSVQVFNKLGHSAITT